MTIQPTSQELFLLACRDRFMSKVDKNGPISAHRPDLGPCWVWTGAKIRGYGRFWTNKRHVMAHHFLLSERVPTGMAACHHCDNRACVNPAHIFIGTRSDNMRDCVSKGRLANNSRRGEANNTTILTEAQAMEAKHCSLKRGALSAMAREFGVGIYVLSNIRKGRTWKHLA